MRALKRMAAMSVMLVLIGVVGRASAACPVSEGDRFSESELVVVSPGRQTVGLTPADLARLPPTQLSQRRIVSSGSSSSTEQGVVYGGVLLRDVLRTADLENPADRRSRFSSVQAVATDGYRAVFSWGELFNSPAGDQVLLILSQDGRALDAAGGPLALRALGDVRPGPRHVRNLCGLVIANTP
jgi:hypothetical protein